jgi:aryl-phospho-beta-D-glucosidase BglC (GH1 family)
VSVEWYYSDDSYLSVGYFHKDVENFIGIEEINEPLFNMPHPGQGAYADEARAALAQVLPVASSMTGFWRTGLARQELMLPTASSRASRVILSRF